MEISKLSAWKEEFDLRQRMVNVAKEIGEEHLTRDEGPYLGGGNISSRIPNTDTVLIKPTGYSIPKLKPEDFSVVKLDGTLISGAKPSSETTFHTALIRSRSDVNAVCHVHSFWTGVWGSLPKPIPIPALMWGGGSFLEEVEVLPYKRGGTSTELSDALVNALKTKNSCIIQYHGQVGVGPTIEAAYANASKTEELCKMAWHATTLAGALSSVKPVGLTEEFRLKMLEARKARAPRSE